MYTAGPPQVNAMSINDPETGDLPASLMDDVDRGLRRVLGL